jgi:LCP family protein required for cell wall assembly
METENKKSKTPRNVLWVLGLISILLISLAFILYGALGKEKISIMPGGTNTNSINEPLSVVALGQVGVGQGGRWHFAPNLTDSIVLIHFRPETKMVNLISIPRDLYGNFGDERIKINQVASDGKILELLKMLSEITGIETDKYVIFDLDLVKGVIDGLGGINIDLPTATYDPVGSFNLSAGANHLNGEDAVWLIRNRYAPQGDFFREKNQHLVLEAIFTQFNQLTALEKTSFIFRILPYLSQSVSNFSLGEAISNLKDIDRVSFNSIVLDFDTELWQSSKTPNPTGEGAYVLIPKKGINEYGAVRSYIEERLK